MRRGRAKRLRRLKNNRDLAGKADQHGDKTGGKDRQVEVFEKLHGGILAGLARLQPKAI